MEYLGLSLVFALRTLHYLVVWLVFSPRREQYSLECFLWRFLPCSSCSLNLGRLFFLLVLLPSSEAANFSPEMLSVVSTCLQCSTKVSRSPVYGFKPWEINIALWLLGALLSRESTNSDSSSFLLSWKRGGICAILALRSRANPTYCLVVSLRGFSKQKRYLCHKMEKPRKLNTRQYVGLVCDLNSRMAQMPPFFQDSQQIDESDW